jgi:hypothetical protein
MVRIFALEVEVLIAKVTDEHAIIAFWRFANIAVAKLIPLRKVVALSAPSVANLGHFTVCALLCRASRHTRTFFSKPCTVTFAKASA